MSIETFFPKSGGFLDTFLGGSGRNLTNDPQQHLAARANSIKSLKGRSSLSTHSGCISRKVTKQGGFIDSFLGKSKGHSLSTSSIDSLLVPKIENGKKKYQSLKRVLRNEERSPFSKKDFAAYLDSNGLKDVLLFLKSVEEYAKFSAPLYLEYNLDARRTSRKVQFKKDFGDSLLLKIGEEEGGQKSSASKSPSLLSTQNYIELISYLEEIGSKLGNRYILAAENCLQLPETIIRNFQELSETADMHPRIFETAYFYVFDTLEQGPFVEFLKQGRMIVSEVSGYTVRDIVLKTTPSPYSFDDFAQYAVKKGFENDLTFLSAVLAYQKDSEVFYPQRLMQISNHDGLTSPIEAIIPNRTASTEKTDNVNTLESLAARFKGILETYITEGATSQIYLDPGIQTSIVKRFNDGSSHPDFLCQSFEFVMNNIRLNHLSDFLISQHGVAKLNAEHEMMMIPNYSLSELLGDTALSPYSKRDFLGFIHQSGRAQYYMEFLADLKEHEKSSKIFFSYISATKLEFKPTEDELEKFLLEVKAEANGEPRKPDGMEESEFQAIKRIHLNNARYIFESYLFHDAKKRLFDLSNESVQYVSSCLAKGNFNPLVFMAEKLSAEAYFETKIVGQFLKQAYEDRLAKGMSMKAHMKSYTKMEKVLLDESDPPYNYQSFYNYCKKQEASEGLEFIRAVLKYSQNAYIFYESPEGEGRKAPKQHPKMSDSEYLSICLSLKAECKSICENYLGFVAPLTKAKTERKQRFLADSDDAKDEASNNLSALEFLSHLERRKSSTNIASRPVKPAYLKLPEEIYKPLASAREAEFYHPNIFTRAFDFYYTQIENRAWQGFVRFLDPAGIYDVGIEEEPKITIKQLALDELPSPYSYQDYRKFLQTQLCHEAIEFLRDCYQCQINAEPLYEIRIIKQNNANSQALTDLFIPSALRPLDIPEAGFKKLLTAHTNHFKDIVEKFINPGSPSEVNLPVKYRKPFFTLYQEGYSHPEMLDDLIVHISDMLKQNNLNKFLKQASDAAANAAKNANIEDISLMALVLDTLPSPFSTKDYMLYLKQDSGAESLEFLLSIVDYHSFASPYYSDMVHDIEPENFKEIRLQCELIAETYIYPHSQKAIPSITDSIKKNLRIELVKENFHPDIWRPVFKVVAAYLKKEKMSKFLKRFA